MSDHSPQMKWEDKSKPMDTVLTIQVVEYEYQTQLGIDGILINAKIQIWVTKRNKEKRMVRDEKSKEESG